MNKKKYLSFWEEDCKIEDFKKWCGSHKTEWKVLERNYIKEKNYKNVLDVGAGLYSEYYGFKDDNINIKYKATEITDKFIDIGKSEGIDVIKSHAQELPFDDNSFDVVLCYDLLNHQLDFKDVILELYRVTRGDVIISFFKRFIEEEAAVQEVNKNLLVDRFKVEKSEKTNGIIVHRLTNEKGETTAIYHFYSYNEIVEFLKENNIQFDFYQVGDKRILKIKKSNTRE